MGKKDISRKFSLIDKPYIYKLKNPEEVVFEKPPLEEYDSSVEEDEELTNFRFVSYLCFTF